MTFLTSILLGLSMGAGALFSIYQGQGDTQRLKAAVLHAFGLIFVIAAVLNVGVYLFIDPIMAFLHVPKQVYPLMRDYLWIIFAGVGAAFLYNFFAGLLRAMGNSSVPLIFLSISACLNIGLDLLFVLVFGWGVKGAAGATVIAKYAAGLGITLYTFIRCKNYLPSRTDLPFHSHLRTAVRHEFRNPDGTGPGEQLRAGNHGGFCRSRQNRFLRLHASSGFRKCLFYLRGSELWSRKRRAYSDRH